MVAFLLSFLLLVPKENIHPLAQVLSESLSPTEKNKIMRDYYAAEKKLVAHLFDGYEKDIPATYGKYRTDQNGLILPLVANVSLVYTKMLTLNEIEQNIRLIAESYITWEDFRLIWDPAEFSGVDAIVLPREKVWIPDIVPSDLSEWTDTFLPERQMVTLFFNGTVTYYSAGIGSFMCYLDITDFPFDSQECSVPYATFFTISSELQLKGDFADDYDFKAISNNLWTATSQRYESRNFTDSVHYWSYSEVRFLFTFQRSDGYYVVLIIIPSFVLTFLCMAGLFWAPISFDTYMEKLNLGFAAILAMVLVLQMTTDSIPKTSQIPILSIYSLINLTLITAASLAVLIIGKYLAVKKCRSSSASGWKTRLVENVHMLCLVAFSAAATANLIVLLLRRK